VRARALEQRGLDGAPGEVRGVHDAPPRVAALRPELEARPAWLNATPSGCQLAHALGRLAHHRARPRRGRRGRARGERVLLVAREAVVAVEHGGDARPGQFVFESSGRASSSARARGACSASGRRQLTATPMPLAEDQHVASRRDVSGG
jgi:hypothetical protein